MTHSFIPSISTEMINKYTHSITKHRYYHGSPPPGLRLKQFVS
jgi:hypothetical protein